MVAQQGLQFRLNQEQLHGPPVVVRSAHAITITWRMISAMWTAIQAVLRTPGMGCQASTHSMTGWTPLRGFFDSMPKHWLILRGNE